MIQFKDNVRFRNKEILISFELNIGDTHLHGMHMPCTSFDTHPNTFGYYSKRPVIISKYHALKDISAKGMKEFCQNS